MPSTNTMLTVTATIVAALITAGATTYAARSGANNSIGSSPSVSAPATTELTGPSVTSQTPSVSRQSSSRQAPVAIPSGPEVPTTIEQQSPAQPTAPVRQLYIDLKISMTSPKTAPNVFTNPMHFSWHAEVTDSTGERLLKDCYLTLSLSGSETRTYSGDCQWTTPADIFELGPGSYHFKAVATSGAAKGQKTIDFQVV